MPPAFSEGESAALPLSADMVQEPDKRDQKQESGQHGAACAESGQFVADVGMSVIRCGREAAVAPLSALL